DLQASPNGGPIIAIQLEHEYGSFGDSLQYLHFLRSTLRSIRRYRGILRLRDCRRLWSGHQLNWNALDRHDVIRPATLANLISNCLANASQPVSAHVSRRNQLWFHGVPTSGHQSRLDWDAPVHESGSRDTLKYASRGCGVSMATGNRSDSSGRRRAEKELFGIVGGFRWPLADQRAPGPRPGDPSSVAAERSHTPATRSAAAGFSSRPARSQRHLSLKRSHTCGTDQHILDRGGAAKDIVSCRNQLLRRGDN
uniref:Beta-galactosidase n=1 Tax=Macrostomum lignano TaxID=282301 RepID=A0A1I8FMC1_9PLAT